MKEKGANDIASLLMQQEMATVNKGDFIASARDLYIMYTAYKEAGFTANQAFALIKTTIEASITAGLAREAKR